jgi:hypothetical protein
MKVHVIVVDADPGAIMAAGSRHPILGTFLDSGTCATIAAPIETLLDGLGSMAAIEIRRTDGEAIDTEELYDALAAGDALSFAAGARGDAFTAWWICGYALPSLGAIGERSVDDVRHTCLRLAGEPAGTGRYLLEDCEETFDPAVERSLTSRLRELYGD